jgi:pimeloyl-ACP methyl ester carboxylesterase
MARWTRRGFVAAGLSIAGCARLDRPPLGPLYRPTQDSVDQPPLIVIPGAFGSRLRDRRTGREIWPRSDRNLLVSSYRDLELDIDADRLEPKAGGIEAYDIFEAGLGRDFYGQVLRTLQQAGGYVRCGNHEKPRADRRNFYVYPYDFRLEDLAAAQGLHELIERIRVDFGDPRLRVDVLAHSNGGLLARYYARYGTAETPAYGPFKPTQVGAAAIRRLLLVGTPNLGTLQPVLSLLRGEEVLLGQIPHEVMASCPGTMQTMPHPAIPWLVDLQGRTVDRDLYDIATWRESRWSIFDPRVAERTIAEHGGGAAGRRYLELLREYHAKYLRRARRFVESLAVPGGPDDLRPFVFGGDCELTLARLVAEEVEDHYVARERVREIEKPLPGVDYEALMFEPGDTVVTRSSLLGRRTLDIAAPRSEVESLQVAHSVFFCEHHQQLTGNPSFQDNLLNSLLSVDPA